MGSVDLASSGMQLNANLTKGIGDTFGNYMLHGIEEVQLPEVIAWWPQAVGWKIVLALILLWIGKQIYRAITKWRGNHYRRRALKKLAQLQSAETSSSQTIRQLPVLLKATALQAYPRTEVAHLSGQAWLTMLDSKWSESTFSSVVGERLLTINYQNEQYWQLDSEQIDELIDTIRRWIRKHHVAGGVANHV